MRAGRDADAEHLILLGEGGAGGEGQGEAGGERGAAAERDGHDAVSFD
ncbi:hypothetical protein BTHI11S_04159 [Bosea thiooxidans]